MGSNTDQLYNTIVNFQLGNEISEGTLTMRKMQSIIDAFPDQPNMEKTVYTLLKAKLQAVENLVSAKDSTTTTDGVTTVTEDTGIVARRKEAVEDILKIANEHHESTATPAATLAGVKSYGDSNSGGMKNKKCLSLFSAISSQAWGKLATVAINPPNAANGDETNVGAELIGTKGDGVSFASGYGAPGADNVIHEDSALAREIFYLMMEGRHGDNVLPIIGDSPRNAVLGQVKADGGNIIYTADANPAGLSVPVWKQDSAASFYNMVAAMLQISRDTGASTGTVDFFGGESGYAYASVKNLIAGLTDQSSTDDAIIKQIYPSRTTTAINASMTAAQLQDSINLGLNELSDYSVTVSKADFDLDIQTLWNKATDHTVTDFKRFSFDATNSPALQGVILANNHFRDNFLKTVIANASNKDIDFKNGVPAALALAMLKADDNTEKRWNTTANTGVTGETQSQRKAAFDLALGYINEVCDLIGREKFGSWRGILEVDTEYVATGANATNTYVHLDLPTKVFTIMQESQVNKADAQTASGYFAGADGYDETNMLEEELYLSIKSSFIGPNASSVRKLLLPTTQNSNGHAALLSSAANATTGKASIFIRVLRDIAKENYKSLSNDAFFDSLADMVSVFGTAEPSDQGLANGTADDKLITLFDQNGAETNGNDLKRLFASANTNLIDTYSETINGAVTSYGKNWIRGQIALLMQNELTFPEKAAFQRSESNMNALRENYAGLFKLTAETKQAAPGNSASPEGSVTAAARLQSVEADGVEDLYDAAGVLGGSSVLFRKVNEDENAFVAADHADSADAHLALLNAAIAQLNTTVISNTSNSESTLARLRLGQSTVAATMSVREIMKAVIPNTNRTLNTSFRNIVTGNAVSDWTTARDSYTSMAAESDTDHNAGQKHRSFVVSMIYKMVSAQSAVDLVETDPSGRDIRFIHNNSADVKSLRQIRKLIKDLSSGASADEMSEYFYAVFNDKDNLGTGDADNKLVSGIDEKLESMANALSLDLEYPNGPQFDYLLTGNTLSVANRKVLVQNVLKHVPITAAEIDTIQNMGEADGATSATRLAAAKADSRVEHIAEMFVKNMSLWATTEDSTGYTGMLKAINELSLDGNDGTGAGLDTSARDHVLLWAAAIGDPDPLVKDQRFGSAYDIPDVRPAGLGEKALDAVLGLVSSSVVYTTLHVVSEVETVQGEETHKAGTSVKRTLTGHCFALLEHDSSAIVIPTGVDPVTSAPKFKYYTGNELA
tara:strand:- start:8116 stop:11862 length:3747 start_codon:yes stop_codon:yes gene_type:complete